MRRALLLLPAAVAARRNVGPFLMLAVPALTRLLHHRDTAEARCTAGTSGAQRRHRRPTAAATVIAVVAWAYSREIPRLRWQPVSTPRARRTRRLSWESLQPLRRGRRAALVRAVAARLHGRTSGPLSDVPRARAHSHRGRRRRLPPRVRAPRHQVRLPSDDLRPPPPRLAKSGWTTLYRDSRWVVLRAN